MTCSVALHRPRRLLAGIGIGVTLLLGVMGTAFAGSAKGEWFCSPNGSQPWQHYSHNFPIFDPAQEHQYVSGHTHSWGDHHHVWDHYTDRGFVYQGQIHANCGPA
jgi:hypothetical protein